MNEFLNLEKKTISFNFFTFRYLKNISYEVIKHIFRKQTLSMRVKRTAMSSKGKFRFSL